MQVLIKQEIQRKSGYAIQADEEQLRVQLDTIQCELNAPTQFKVSTSDTLTLQYRSGSSAEPVTLFSNREILYACIY